VGDKALLTDSVCMYVGLPAWRRVRGGLPSLCGTLVCNKIKSGIPFAIGKHCKTKNYKTIHTIGLESYA